jgi:hypothetical protein
MLIRNVGKVDRIARLAIAAILLYLGSFVLPGTIFGVFFAILAMVLLMTGTLGFCPFYRYFKFSTYPESRHS